MVSPQPVGFNLGEHMKPNRSEHSEHSELSVQSEQMDAGARLDRAKHKRNDFQICDSGAFQQRIKTNNPKTCLQLVGAVAHKKLSATCGRGGPTLLPTSDPKITSGRRRAL